MSGQVKLVLHITQLIVQALDSLLLLLSPMHIFGDLEGLLLELGIFFRDLTLIVANLFFQVAQLLLRCVQLGLQLSVLLVPVALAVPNICISRQLRLQELRAAVGLNYCDRIQLVLSLLRTLEPSNLIEGVLTLGILTITRLVPEVARLWYTATLTLLLVKLLWSHTFTFIISVARSLPKLEEVVKVALRWSFGSVQWLGHIKVKRRNLLISTLVRLWMLR